MEKTAIVGWQNAASSSHATEWLAERQSRLGQPMALVHVTDASASSRIGEQPGRGAQDDAEAQQEAMLLRHTYPQLDVTVHAWEGDPFEVLRQLSFPTNVVAVGRRRSAHAGAAAGSGLAERLASIAVGPVAVVPAGPFLKSLGVVVGVDGTESSLEALAFAAQEASDRQQPLEVVHTWLEPTEGTFDAGMDRAAISFLKSRHEALLQESLVRVREAYPGLKVRQLVVQGLPAKVLLREALGGCLLVVGNHGRQSVARFLLGSVSSAVLRGAERVTVVVKGSAFAEPGAVHGGLSAALHP